MLATFLGAGYSPVAPGTAGSLAALPLAWVAASNAPWGIVVSALLLPVAIASAGEVARERGDDDPGIVVIDEVLGMTIAAIGLGATWWNLLIAFLCFRLFDIVKPWPCRRLEGLPGGWGIVMDDVMAGLYALACAHLLRPFLSVFFEA